MNKIIDWFKGLELEIIILLALLVIVFILAIYIVIKNHKIYNAIAKKTLSAKEDLILEDETHKARVIVTNIGYTNTVVKELGFIYKKTKLPTVTEEFNLSARNFNTTTIPIDELRTFVLGNNNKVKKFYFYVVDSINRTTKTKLKLSFKYIKNQIKAEENEISNLRKAAKKEARAKAKEFRYDNGEYNFGDRLVLIVSAIFSPLSKLFKLIGRKINHALHNRQIKKQVKKELLEKQKEVIAKENIIKEEELREKTADSFSKKLDKKNEKRLDKIKMKETKKVLKEEKESLEDSSNIEDVKEINIDNDINNTVLDDEITTDVLSETPDNNLNENE